MKKFCCNSRHLVTDKKNYVFLKSFIKKYDTKMASTGSIYASVVTNH